jgi:hypothetical protein
MVANGVVNGRCYGRGPGTESINGDYRSYAHFEIIGMNTRRTPGYTEVATLVRRCEEAGWAQDLRVSPLQSIVLSCKEECRTVRS